MSLPIQSRPFINPIPLPPIQEPQNSSLDFKYNENITELEPDNDWVYVQKDQVDLLSSASIEMKVITEEEIECFFQNYVTLFCPKYTKQAVASLVRQGQNLLIALRNNSAETLPHQQRRQLISPLVWILMFTAHKQNLAFEQGMFVFDDPDYRLVNFFSVVATSRPSSHFHKRREDSWGIDVEQNYLTGLPGNHQTAHFGRLKENQNRQKRSFLKPENWGMETWWQWLRHFMDYMWTRVHNPQDELKRKEHCPQNIINYFTTLYVKLTHHSEIPLDIDTFGISGMVRFLMHYLETNPENEQLYLIPPFLKWLDENYPDISELDRKGDEVILCESILFDEPMITSASDCNYKKFQAFLQLKTAACPEEIIAALKALSTFKLDKDWMPQPTMIPDHIAVYDKKGDKKKEAVLLQVNCDLTRSNNENESFLLNGVSFKKTAEDLFFELKKHIEDDNHALNALILMSQGTKKAITSHMMKVMCSPIPGLHITPYCESLVSEKRQIAQVEVFIHRDYISIEIWQIYVLRASEYEKITFRDDPYAILKGWTQIKLPTNPHLLKDTHAYTKWAIEKVL